MGEMAALRYPAFTAAHPGVTAVFEDTPDYSAKLAVLAAADGLGDLAMVYLSSGSYQLLAPFGALSDHTPFVTRDKYDLKQFYDLAIDAIRLDGRIYGLPFKAQVANVALFWNVEMFEAAGVRQPTPTWTYADLADAAGRLTRREGDAVAVHGVAWNWRALTTVSASLRPWGADVLSPDGRRVQIDRPEARDALEYHYDLVLKQQAATLPPLVADPLVAFADGKAAMLTRALVGNAGLIIQRGQGKLRWGMVRMPKGRSGRRGGMLLPSTMSVTRPSRHQDLAWELCKWTCDRESGIALAMQVQGSSTPGARPDVYQDPRLTNRPGYPAQYADEQRQAMAEPEPFLAPWNLSGSDFNTALGAELDKITRGEIALSATSLQAATGPLQAIVDRPPPRLG
jgi:ABC-type glycerol-3-phosphate transport system substrate-binding protein